MRLETSRSGRNGWPNRDNDGDDHHYYYFDYVKLYNKDSNLKKQQQQQYKKNVPLKQPINCCCYCCRCCCYSPPRKCLVNCPKRQKSIKLKLVNDYIGFKSESKRKIENYIEKETTLSLNRPNLINSILHTKKKYYYERRGFFSYITKLFLLFLCLQLSSTHIKLIKSSSIDSHYFPTTNKTGQFSIAQLCPRGSNIPVTRKVEGAALVSTFSDIDINCTITFRTKTAHQHFIIRFEELKLGCDDHLILFDQDADYGQASIHDYSCRDNMASVRDIRTSGTFLTVRYISDSISQPSDGFRIVITAVFDTSDCPAEYAYCRDHYCISRSLFCDGIFHCLDKSDEIGCHGQEDPNDLPYALGLLVVLVLAISSCVIIFIATIYCRRENPSYTQYQHHLQRTFGFPMQASTSIMFPNHHQQAAQYQFFQPTPQMSPYVTPQHHHALIATTLPRGYSTLPLNFAGTTANATMTGRHPQAYPQAAFLTKANNFIMGNPNGGDPNNINANTNVNNNANEYLMMTGLTTGQQHQFMTALPHTTTVGQPVVVSRPLQHTTTLTSLPNSQSLLNNVTPRHNQAISRDRGS